MAGPYPAHRHVTRTLSLSAAPAFHQLVSTSTDLAVGLLLCVLALLGLHPARAPRLAPAPALPFASLGLRLGLVAGRAGRGST